MLLKLINPLFRDRLPLKTGFSNDPLKSISESTKKLKLSDFKVNLLSLLISLLMNTLPLMKGKRILG